MRLLSRLYGEGWRRADVALAVVLAGFSWLVIHEANRLPPPFFDPLGSAAVPRTVALILIGLALFLITGCLARPVTPRSTGGTGEAGGGAPGVAVGAAVVPVLYVGAMQAGILGFGPASALFVIVLGGILSRWRRGAVMVLVPVGLLAGYGLQGLLTEFFYLDLPQHSFWMGRS